MEFRPNLTVSFILHAALLIAAVTLVARRDAIKRVPFTPLYVELTAGSPASPQHTSSITRREPFPKTAAVSLPSIAPIRSSQQTETKVTPAPGDWTKKDANIAPPGKTRGEDSVRSRGFSFIDNSLISGSSPITSIAGRTETQSSGRSIPEPVEKMGTTHTDAMAAIRSALERAKYYPLIAKRRGIEGTVTVEFSVDSKGMPENIKILQGSGSDILDSAALATVTRAAPFPHDIRTIVPISFKLEKD